MFEHDIHHISLHLLPVLVSAVIQWMLGAVWYSPLLFAKPWMAIVGIQPGGGKNKSMIAGMISSFVGSFLLSFVLAHMIVWSGASSLATGAFVGFLLWLGFIASPLFAQGIYEGRPFRLFAINTGYWLVGIVGTGAMLAVWR